MKQYQVTKKLQVTIPKKLALRVGIAPGDAVAFEETDGEITLKKVGQPHRSAREMALALRGFASDLEKLAPHLKEGRRILNENLSRHVSAE